MITFADGRTFKVGQRVLVQTKHGTRGWATVLSVTCDTPNWPTLQVRYDADANVSPVDKGRRLTSCDCSYTGV